MQKSLFQRLIGETPAFEKKVQIICLVLLAIAGHLSFIPGLPSNYLLLLQGILVGVAVFAQFAMKDIEKVAAAPSVAEGLMDIIPDMMQQFAQVRNTITDQAQSHTAILRGIDTSLSLIKDSAPVPAPLVNIQVDQAPVIPAPDAAAPAPILTRGADQKTN